MTDGNRRIILVDEDPDAVWAIGSSLTRAGFSVTTCGDGEEALSLLESRAYDVLITDIRLPKIGGLALVDWARDNRPAIKVVVTTASGSPVVKNLTLSKGALLYLEKPVDTDLLISVISESDQKKAFRGSIDAIDILEYVQLIMLSGRRLVLEVLSQEGIKGVLYIDKGEICHAVCDELEGEAAVYACLSSSEGSFVNLPWTQPDKITVTRPGRFLLIEAARQRDEKKPLDSDAAD